MNADLCKVLDKFSDVIGDYIIARGRREIYLYVDLEKQKEGYYHERLLKVLSLISFLEYVHRCSYKVHMKRYRPCIFACLSDIMKLHVPKKGVTRI